MEIDVVMPQKVNIKTIQIHAKVCDSGSYTLYDQQGKEIARRSEDYVPGFFPEQHHGDYLILNIDIETGQITNWKKPTSQDIADAFKFNELKSEK